MDNFTIIEKVLVFSRPCRSRPWETRTAPPTTHCHHPLSPPTALLLPEQPAGKLGGCRDGGGEALSLSPEGCNGGTPACLDGGGAAAPARSSPVIS